MKAQACSDVSFTHFSESEKPLRALPQRGRLTARKKCLSLLLFLSGDNRHVAVAKSNTVHNEVTVRPFPVRDRGWRISTADGEEPVWPRDAKPLDEREIIQMRLVVNWFDEVEQDMATIGSVE